MARFAEQAVNVAFAIACTPIICAYLVVTACFCPSTLNPRPPFYRDKKEYERRQHYAPSPLPARPLERSLTDPPPGLLEGNAKESEDTKKKRTGCFSKLRSSRAGAQKTLPQSQSPLFNLPLEIRLLIYKYAVGNRTIHIVQRKHRLGHIECSARPGSLCPTLLADNHHHRFPQCLVHRVDSSSILIERRTKNPLALLSPRSKPKKPKHKKKKNKRKHTQTQTQQDHADDAACTCSALDLLVTCRRLYAEAITSLYTTNTFAISDLTCLAHLHATIPEARFAHIRHLHLQWTFSWPAPTPSAFFAHNYGLYPPHDEDTWEATWELIASHLPRLHSLTVELHSGCWTNLAEGLVLRVICKSRVRVPRERFVVLVDWPMREREVPEDAPFTLARPKWAEGLNVARTLADLV